MNLININLTPIKNKYNIICEYDIKKEKNDKNNYLNQRIINSYEEVKRAIFFTELGINNEKEIKKILNYI